jgi:hypothetical protein
MVIFVCNLLHSHLVHGCSDEGGVGGSCGLRFRV